MRGKILGGVMVVLVSAVLAGLALPTHSLCAAPRVARAAKPQPKETKKNGISVDVVIEDVDFAANTISARGTIHVVPPHDKVGGQIFHTGTTDSHRDQATQYVRLPVMPAANLKDKKPKAGQHAILRLEMLRPGSFVVVGIEEFTAAERIGVESLDAPAAKLAK